MPQKANCRHLGCRFQAKRSRTLREPSVIRAGLSWTLTRDRLAGRVKHTFNIQYSIFTQIIETKRSLMTIHTRTYCNHILITRLHPFLLTRNQNGKVDIRAGSTINGSIGCTGGWMLTVMILEPRMLRQR